MKKTSAIALLAALVIGGSAAWAGKKPKMPEFLRPGDKVALLSMSSRPGNVSTIDSAAQVLRGWGYEVEIGAHAKSEWHTFAGTPEERKADIMQALRDKRVKAIMSSRGGYGSANVLALVPLDTLKKYPKWIIGYSDITGYLSAEVAAGNMAIHANMGGHLAETGGKDYQSQVLRRLLQGELPSYDSLPGHPYNQAGTATGIVIGGNMSVYGDLAGSPYDFLNDKVLKGQDVILFIEDVGESYMKLDRMLQYLRLRGVLARVKGIIVGRYAECGPNSGWTDVPTLLHHYLQDVKDIPICYDFPTGHDESWNYPLVEGCPAKLTVSQERVSLRFLKH